jgi:cytochrome c-type biogenesis protein CcmE
MKPRHRKALIALGLLAAVGTAVGLVLSAFNDNLVFFYTPTQVAQQEAPRDKSFRMGGLVQQGSVVREGLAVRFVVTDLKQHQGVRYEGLLPDLFKEGKGVVVQGRLDAQGQFVAREVLAKHDENYMPPEAAAALERAAAGGDTAGKKAP